MKVKSLLKSDNIISKLRILKVRKINPDDHIHRLRFKWTLQDKCELVFEVNIYQNKRILKENQFFCTLLYTCVQDYLTSIMW